MENLQYKKKKLHFGGIPVSKLARDWGTPLYVYSEEGFLNSFRELDEGLDPLERTICYAVKSNSNLSIVRMLARNGAGMDVVSGGELYRCSQAGVKGNRIVFSGVGKSNEEIEAALKYKDTGIYSFNIESPGELEVIESLARKNRTTAGVVFRFNPDVDAKSHPYISTGLKKNKFGLEKKEVLQIANQFKKSKWIKIRGVSSHIGSQIMDLSAFDEAFAKTSKMTNDLQKVLPYRLESVDLGGGTGIRYSKERLFNTKKYCSLIKKHFDDDRNLRIVLEPGRSLSGNAGVLLTEVLYIKSRRSKRFIIVDASMSELIRPALYQGHHEILTADQKTGKKSKADVVGPVCETADFLAQDRALPNTIREGDLLTVASAGAYGFVMSSNYNSRPRPAEILIENDGRKPRARLIRRRESYNDLIRGE